MSIESRPLVQNIFEGRIAKGARVLVPGPNVGPYCDPTLLWATSWVHEGGTVYIADPQNDTVPHDGVGLANLVAHVVGDGNVSKYEQYIAVLRESGLPMAETLWLGHENVLWNMPRLNASSIDGIIDHYTSAFVIGKIGGTRKKQEELWEKIITEYHRVLRSQGVLLLLVNDRRGNIGPQYISWEEVTRILETKGFSVSTMEVEDQVRIPVGEKVKDNLERIARDRSRESDADIAGVYRWGMKWKDENAEIVFIPKYTCFQLIIAVKQ